MNDIKKITRYSLQFGLIGAVLIPIIYECYANISKSASMVLLGAWAVFIGLKFSSMKAKPAILGMCATLAYSGVFGFIFYVFLHPLVVKALEKKSVYFYLSLKDQMWFLLYAAIIMLCMFVVCFAKYGICKAIKQVKGNNEKTEMYIKDAFSDEE